jgi:hypothetical protein
VTLLHVQDRAYREIHLSGQQAEEQKRIDQKPSWSRAYPARKSCSGPPAAPIR